MRRVWLRDWVAKVTKLVWHRAKYDFRLVFVEDIPFCSRPGKVREFAKT